MVGLLYQADTPTNVCPSIHVSSSVAIALTGWNSELLKGNKWLRLFLAVWTVLILSLIHIYSPAGVDIEKERTIRPGIMRFLTDEEKVAVERDPNPYSRFFDFWVLKRCV